MNDYFGPDEPCEMCGADCADGERECAICHYLGCPRCLTRWDDVYPWLCDECAAALSPIERKQDDQ